MQKLMLWIIALAILQASALFAQSLTGTWQGSLKLPNRELRIVFKISTTDQDTLKAVLYSIDQGAQPIPANTVTAQGSAIKISVLGIGGTYEGKLSADGNSIAGTWTQGQPFPLALARATPATAWTIPEPPPPPKAMAANADPTFEVATIKPSDPSRPGRLFRIQVRHFSTINTTLGALMSWAYNIHPQQIAGAPAWLDSQKFDLDGKPDGEGQPSMDQWKTMVQKLMAERFQLKFHHEQKELSVYALVVAKNGPKINKSEGDPNAPPSLLFRGLGVLPVRNASMEEFTQVMQMAVLPRPVVDQTGLKGKYDFMLQWTPDETQFTSLGGVPPNLPEKPDAPPDLFTAIQQQAGLKLESTKAMVDMLVIDKVEKPSEN
jgi:uncharacterized protein (TIGR03435 family)